MLIPWYQDRVTLFRDSAKLVLDTALESSSALRCSTSAAGALGLSSGVGDYNCSAGADVDSLPQPVVAAEGTGLRDPVEGRGLNWSSWTATREGWPDDLPETTKSLTFHLWRSPGNLLGTRD
ncbi:hypothetical protein MTO96_014472 [Rhipicephalus appendiculatus]